MDWFFNKTAIDGMLNHYIENQLLTKQHNQCLFLLMSPTKQVKVNEKSGFFTINLDDVLENLNLDDMKQRCLFITSQVQIIWDILITKRFQKDCNFSIILLLFFIDSGISKNCCFYNSIINWFFFHVAT